MNLAIKIFLVILLIIIGIFPNLFVVINANQVNWYNRLTTPGIILMVMMVLAIVFSVYDELESDKENEKTQEALTSLNESLNKANSSNLKLVDDIKNALTASNLEYDPNKKTIINNNITANPSGNLVSIVGNGPISNIDLKGNVMGPQIRMEYHEILGSLAQARIRYNISTRQVYLGVFKGTSGGEYLDAMRKILTNNGFKILGEYKNVEPYADHDTKGAKVARKNGELFVIIGDPIFDKYDH